MRTGSVCAHLTSTSRDAVSGVEASKGIAAGEARGSRLDGQPTSRFFDSCGLRLHYVDWGNRDAPPLVLQHGGRDQARSWDTVARAMCDRFHVIAPDLRGHGDSAWAPGGDYGDAAYLADMAALLDGFGEEAVAIVGHSLGGSIALRYAALRPQRVRRLAAIEGLRPIPAKAGEPAIRAVLTEWLARRAQLATAEPRRFDDVEAALARMRRRLPTLSDKQLHHLTTHALRRDEAGGWRWKHDPALGAGVPIDLSDAALHALWGAIRCPVMLVHGEDSWAANPERDGRAALFADARVLSLAGAGHWVQHDRCEALVAALEAFL